MLNTRERIALAGDVAQWGAHAVQNSFDKGRIDHMALLIWESKARNLEYATQLANGWNWERIDGVWDWELVD